MDIQQLIVNEIELLANQKIKNYDEIIFGDGAILDSLNILHILLFIEKKFDIKFNYKDLKRENFNTVNKIVNYVKEKLNE